MNIHMGVSISSATSSNRLRLPTERSGVGTVNSGLISDPDRGFRAEHRKMDATKDHE